MNIVLLIIIIHIYIIDALLAGVSPLFLEFLQWRR